MHEMTQPDVVSGDDDVLLTEPAYPFQRHMGFVMKAWSADRAVFELPLQDYLNNRYGIPHGGVYAVLLDTVMGYSGSYTGDPAVRRKAMTLSLTTHFVSRPSGDVLIAEGRRTGGGKSTFFAEGRITDATGALIASGTGVFRYTGVGD